VATKSISRSDLHALVWARPMRDVAADFRISDVGLKKICAKHDIPVPPQGHWQRIAHGHASKTLPLKSGRPAQVIDIRMGDTPPDLSADEVGRLAELLAYEDNPDHAIVVSQDDVKLHPVAAAARKALLADKPDEDWGAVRFKSAALEIRVSPSGIARAMKIVDALFKGMQSRGFADPETKMIVIEGERFPLTIEEVQRRVPHVQTPDDKARHKAREKMSWEKRIRDRWSEARWDFRPSNEFSIKRWYSTVVIKDSSRGTIEERLREVPAILMRAAFANREEDRQRQRRQRYLDGMAERRRFAARLREIDDEATARLDEHARRWGAAERIRAFIGAVEALKVDSGLEARRRHWIDWASIHVANLDPLNEPSALFGGDLDEIEELTALLARDPPVE